MQTEEKKVNIPLSEGREVEIGTGKLGCQANGSCTVRLGDTIVFVSACDGPPRGLDFFPLQVDYREKFSASGRIPGGYIKREGRPSDKEILVCRMTDRPIRSLFPDGYFDEVQIQALVLSADEENNPDTLAMLGASVSLALSDLPFNGPIGALRVGRVNGEFIANPTRSQMEESDVDLIYAGLSGKVIMIEGDADECSEEELRDALAFADENVKAQIEAINRLRETAGKEKKEPELFIVPDEISAAVEEACAGRIEEACFMHAKSERYAALKDILEELKDSLLPKFEEVDDAERCIKTAFESIQEKTVRNGILRKQKRSDGRGFEDLRELSAEV